jgi:hypothetical protein
MKPILFCFVAAAAIPALAQEMVASNGKDMVRLYDTACSNDQVLSRVTPRIRALLRNASAVVDGRSFKACWAVDGTAAHLLYEDGDQGLIPLSDFKEPQTA